MEGNFQIHPLCEEFQIVLDGPDRKHIEVAVRPETIYTHDPHGYKDEHDYPQHHRKGGKRDRKEAPKITFRAAKDG